MDNEDVMPFDIRHRCIVPCSADQTTATTTTTVSLVPIIWRHPQQTFAVLHSSSKVQDNKHNAIINTLLSFVVFGGLSLFHSLQMVLRFLCVCVCVSTSSCGARSLLKTAVQ